MLTGDQLREARERAGMTQQQLGDRIGKSMRSVGNWERDSQVPAGAERLLRREFPDWFGMPTSGPTLSTVSDALLLAEIARRFDRGKDGEGHGREPAPIGEDDGAPPALSLAARETGRGSRVQRARDEQDEQGES